MKTGQKLKPEDLVGNLDIDFDVTGAEPTCTYCLPPKALKDHKTLGGVLIHERIDCPSGTMYMINEKWFRKVDKEKLV